MKKWIWRARFAIHMWRRVRVDVVTGFKWAGDYYDLEIPQSPESAAEEEELSYWTDDGAD